MFLSCTLAEIITTAHTTTFFSTRDWLRHENYKPHTTVSSTYFRPTQPPNLSGTGNEYQPKCGDALRLGSKVHSTCG